MNKQPYGKMPDGTPVDLYTLTGSGGLETRITNYGGVVVSVTIESWVLILLDPCQ